VLYGAKIGLEKGGARRAAQGAADAGGPLCSDSRALRVPDRGQLAQLGKRLIVSVPTTDDNEMVIEALASRLRDVVRSGRRIACLVADGNDRCIGLDDWRQMVRVRDDIVREFALDYVRTCMRCVIGGPGACSTITTSRRTRSASGIAPFAPRGRTAYPHLGSPIHGRRLSQDRLALYSRA
jgi:hypothetical protein